MKTELARRPPVLSQHYSDRQMIVVTDDAVVAALHRAELEALGKEGVKNETREGRTIVWDIATKILFSDPLTELVRTIAEEALAAAMRANERGVQLLHVGKSEAVELEFPPGHPREKVIYVGHPAIPRVYYTVADFHRVTFEHKFSEAIDLLMHLGAKKIRVEHVRGWSKDFSSRLSVPLGEASISGDVAAGRHSGGYLLYEATLSGATEARLPESSAWYLHEPTWQSIAQGRIKFGLQEFSLNVTYEDDYGVNAGLKASALKAGLDLGGKFEDHQATTWRIAGEFGAEQS